MEPFGRLIALIGDWAGIKIQHGDYIFATLGEHDR